MTRLVNAREIIQKAYEGKYAIPHININNLEWAKAVLITAQEKNSPVILGATGGAIKWMGGLQTVSGMVNGLMEDLNITVPVVLHIDHGSYELCKQALNKGFTSVMYDGSHEPFATNLEKSKELAQLTAAKNISLEVEVGTIGGEEDGIVGDGEVAKPKEIAQLAALNPAMIAAGIGNIHGPYPESWTSLAFEAIEDISKAAGRGLVLHGGSGIPVEQVQKAILMGVSKINVNTELQQSNAAAIKEFVISGKIDQGKNFDPRKLLAGGFEAMKATVASKMDEFGSTNKA
ncbi:MAG: ketose-bisphosphate aldolase [Mollicutes bacterium PWAP]|nr:ketose-bisphosphate aldolase [Mollicutes bacterium PWAP]